MTLFRIEMLPAAQGDALWIEYGDPERPQRVIVDCGTKPTYKVLARRIQALPADDRAFELLVVTHVDGDHILGAVPLLNTPQLGATFADIWFNGWRHLPGTVEPMGPVDGEELTFLLAQLEWNRAFKGRAAAVGDRGKLPRVKLPGGLVLTVLAPGSAELEAMKPVWAEEVRKAGLEPGHGRRPTPPDPSGLEPMGAGVPDVEALATAPAKEDTAEANGSSIVLLAEYDGRAVLLCGDAFPTVVRRGVERLLRERGKTQLALSGFKLPHHGSRFNVDLPLLELLDCRDFLYSSNGSKTKHPHLESVAQAIHSAGRPVQLWFNYKTQFNDVWDRAAVKSRYGHAAHYGDGAIAYDVPEI